MDKQMIEEMAKVVRKYYSGFSEYKVAEEIYRILIPESAVVHIDKRLFNEIVNNILLSVKPVYLRKEIASKMLDLTNRLIADTRKETAEKFAEMVKKNSSYCYATHNGIKVGDTSYTISERKIDEICKELVEGENG